MKKYKTFIFDRIVGLFFLIICCFTFISLLSRSIKDPYLGNFTTNQQINNLFGSFGSYFAGTTYTFLGISSYLIPVFFLIFSFKKIFGIKTAYVLIHLSSFVFGIIILSIVFSYWLLNGGIFGEFLIKILNNELDYYLTNKIIFIIFFLCIHALAFLLLFFGLSINYKTIKIIFSPIFIILFFITKLFKLTYLLNFFKFFIKITTF